MPLKSRNTIAEILEKCEADLLVDWLKELESSGIRRDDLMRANEMRAVAITLVELGLSLAGIRTALNIEKGMDLLHASLEFPPGESLNRAKK